MRSDKKTYSKDKLVGSALRRKARLERTIERAQRELAGFDAGSDEESPYLTMPPTEHQTHV